MLYPNYTQALTNAVKELEKQFHGFCTRDAVYGMCVALARKKVDNPRQLQYDIVETLISMNHLTKYVENVGKGPICKNLRIREERIRAARIYAKYAMMLPTQEMLDTRFRDSLYKLYKEYRSSAEYMDRLVRRRMSEISPELIREGDTTRLLILKQFLKEPDFLRAHPAYTDGFRKHIEKQPDVIGADRTLNPAALTDSVFNVLDDADDDKQIKSEIVSLLKYYMDLLPMDDGTRRLLSDALKNPYVSADEISVSDFEPGITTGALTELRDSLLHCRDQIKQTLTAHDIPRIPPEYRLAILAKFYAEIRLSDEDAALLLRTLPAQYVNAKARSKKLSSLLHIESVKAIDRADILAMKTDPAALSELIARIEAYIPEIDIPVTHKSTSDKLNKDGKHILATVLSHTALTRTQTKAYNAEAKAAAEKLPGRTTTLQKLLQIFTRLLPTPLDEQALSDIRRELTMPVYLEELIEKVSARYRGSLSELRKSPAATILRIADNLATGFFDNQKSTRENLYVFAIAFRMTFYAGRNNELLNPATDILKNLFYDYYADNFVNRFRTPQNDRPAEAEVDGYGINYKNFAEMSFLYYIDKEAMTPTEKLDAAFRMIEKCRNAPETKKKKDDSYTPAVELANSDMVRSSAISALISLPEDAFRRHLIENYDCVCTSKPTRNSAENRTAERLYKKLLERVRGMEARIFKSEIDQTIGYMAENDLQNLWRIEYMKKNHCGKCPRRTESTFPDCLKRDDCESSSLFTDYIMSKTYLEKTEKFDELRNEAEARRRRELERGIWNVRRFDWHNGDEGFDALMDYLETELKETTLSVTNELRAPETVTRTNFIALFYYYIVLKSRNVIIGDPSEYDENGDPIKTYEDDYCIDEDNLDEKDFTSFHDYYNYCLLHAVVLKDGDNTYEGLDACLAAAGYQEINPKNLLDIFTLFLAFRDYYQRNINTTGSDALDS